MHLCRFPLMALLSILLLAGSGQAAGSDTVPIDLNRYTGLWHELARTPNRHQDNTPSRDGKSYGACLNTTAEYTLAEPGVITVRNSCTRSTVDGSTYADVATGFAVVVAGSDNRKLKLAFGSSAVGRFFQRAISGGGFGYWIVCIGQTESGPYDYAVISGPDSDFIFVLARTTVLPPDRDAEMRACMLKNNLPVDRLIVSRN